MSGIWFIFFCLLPLLPKMQARLAAVIAKEELNHEFIPPAHRAADVSGHDLGPRGGVVAPLGT